MQMVVVCVDLSETVKAVSVPSRRGCAFVIGGLRGFMHAMPLVGCACEGASVKLANVNL